MPKKVQILQMLFAFHFTQQFSFQEQFIHTTDFMFNSF